MGSKAVSWRRLLSLQLWKCPPILITCSANLLQIGLLTWYLVSNALVKRSQRRCDRSQTCPQIDGSQKSISSRITRLQRPRFGNRHQLQTPRKITAARFTTSGNSNNWRKRSDSLVDELEKCQKSAASENLKISQDSLKVWRWV